MSNNGDQFSPVIFALNTLFPMTGTKDYTVVERTVVLVVVRAMSRDGSDWNTWLSYDSIGRRSGASRSTVKRVLQVHVDGPAPLLMRSSPGATRHHRHRSYRFTLVRDPRKFAAARDEARVRKVLRVRENLQGTWGDRLQLQRQRRDMGGVLSEKEYERALTRLERPAREGLPRRVAVPVGGSN